MNIEHFDKLYKIDCSDKTEKKSNGSVELTYLSWCYAWAEVKKLYPNAKYEILKFENNLPYVFDEKTGYMVFTKVEIEGIEHEMWLPVMDSANKAMKDKLYTYNVKKKEYNAVTKKYEYTLVEKTVEAATMFDINKTIMRCLTKNLAMFGLGLYIYAGEDLPENVEEEKPKAKTNITVKGKEVMITDQQKEKIKELYTANEIKEYLQDVVEKKKLSELTLVEASDFIKRKVEEK